MKKLTILLLIVVTGYSNAQEFWNTVINGDDHYNLSHLTDKALFQDSIILVGGMMSDPSCQYQRLFAYDLKGNRLWTANAICDLVTTDSNYIYTAGYLPMDDVPEPEAFVVAKYNKEGQQIFRMGYSQDMYYNFDLKSIDIMEDGKILISADKEILKTDIAGSAISGFPVAVTSRVESIWGVAADMFILNTKNTIYKSDSILNLTDSISFTEDIVRLLHHNDTLYALFNQEFIRIDTSFNVLDTLISTNEDFQNVEFYDKKFWVQIIASQTIKLIDIFHNQILDTLIFDRFVNSNEFIISQGNYTFLGNSFSGQVGLYNYQGSDLSPGTTILPEIEIVEFTVDSIVIEYVPDFEGEFARGYDFYTELILRNNGSEAIHSFAVFSDLNGGINCSENFFYEEFYDVEIAPGQEYKVDLRKAYQEGINNDRLCFEILAPNSSLESDTQNNSLCRTITITSTEKIEETAYKVYPNPSRDYVFIENTGLKFTEFEILNYSGQLVLKGSLTDSEIQVNMSSLKPGMYLLKLISDRYFQTQKIIKN